MIAGAYCLTKQFITVLSIEDRRTRLENVTKTSFERNNWANFKILEGAN